MKFCDITLFLTLSLKINEMKNKMKNKMRIKIIKVSYLQFWHLLALLVVYFRSELKKLK